MVLQELIFVLLIGMFIAIELIGKAAYIYLALFLLMAISVFAYSFAINGQKVIINKNNLIWLLFPLSITIGFSLKNFHWVRPCIIFFLICIILIIKINIKETITLEKAIVDVALIISVSIFLEWLFPSFFAKKIYPLYPASQSWILNNQVNSGLYYSGIMSNVAYAALMLSVGAIISLVNNKKINFCIIFTALLLTGKRAGLLSFVVLFFVYFVFLKEKNKDKNIRKNKYTIVILVAIFITAMIAIYMLIEQKQFISRYFSFLEIFDYKNGNISLDNYLDKISSGRWTTYKQSFELFLKHPIKGIGWGNFTFMNYNPYLGDAVLNVHNIYLKLLCETGVIGFFSFVIPAFITIRKTWYKICSGFNKKTYVIAFLVQIQFLILGLFETEFENVMFYAVYFAAIFIASNLKDPDQHEVK